jgi:site-specific recombinase XerC
MRELSDKHRVGEHGLKGHRLFADGVKVAFLADQHGATHGIDDSEIALQKRDDLCNVRIGHVFQVQAQDHLEQAALADLHILERVFASPEIVEIEGGLRSPASLHRMKAARRAFFSWTAREGITADNPACTIRLHRLKRKPPGFLTAAEKRRLLKALKGHAGPAALRDRVLIEALFLSNRGTRL